MKKAILIILFAFCTANLFSVPADRKPVTITQPNGKTLTFMLKGDERLNWCETMDGYTLLRDKEGNLCYACIDENGDMTSSCILACNAEERDVRELLFLKKIERGLFFSSSQVEKARKRNM